MLTLLFTPAQNDEYQINKRYIHISLWKEMFPLYNWLNTQYSLRLDSIKKQMILRNSSRSGHHNCNPNYTLTI